jgi:hypothetical protein
MRNANLQAKSHMDNSTAGFAADLLGADRHLPEGCLGIPAEWWSHGERKKLSSLDMLPSRESVLYINRQTSAMLTDILMKHIGSFRPVRSKYFKHQRVKVSPLVDASDRLVTAFELMTFDQSTIDGNAKYEPCGNCRMRLFRI